MRCWRPLSLPIPATPSASTVWRSNARRPDDHAAAQQHFESLLSAHPDYVAGYFQYGQMLGKLARNDEARRTLLTGIETARRIGDQHAASEMEAALAQLPQA